MPFLPGWKTSITIDSIDLTIVGQTLGFSMDSAAIPKPTFGQKFRNTIEGQSVATLSVAGHLSDSIVADLISIEAQSVPVTFQIQIGEAGGDDGGIIDGSAVMSNLTLDADADGQWSWSAELETDGAYNYTPPTP